MNQTDMLTLVEYNQWANNRLMRRAANLSSKQLTAACWLSGGNLMNTLIHLADAQYSWRVACREGSLPGKRLSEEDFAGVKALRAYLKEEDGALIEYVTSLDETALNETIEFRWSQARPRKRTLWHVLVHVVNHGTIHRSEIGQYMDTIGRSPGNMDFIMFTSRER